MSEPFESDVSSKNAAAVVFSLPAGAALGIAVGLLVFALFPDGRSELSVTPAFIVGLIGWGASAKWASGRESSAGAVNRALLALSFASFLLAVLAWIGSGIHQDRIADLTSSTAGIGGLAFLFWGWTGAVIGSIALIVGLVVGSLTSDR